MTANAPPAARVSSGASDGWAQLGTLAGRHQTARRRRLIIRARDWLGVSVIVAVSLTLFAVTYLSLSGR